MPPRLEVRPLQHLTVHRPITAASGSRLSNLLPVQAAGGLVWRVRKGRLELLIVHRPRYDDWSWPKGKLDPYEVPVVAAAREIAEETGVEVVMGVPLPGLKYTQDGRPKQVHFWAARVADAADAPALAARLPIQRADTAEIDDAMWLDVEKVVDKLTYASDLGPLDALLALRGAGRLATVPKVFVRHARQETFRLKGLRPNGR